MSSTEMIEKPDDSYTAAEFLSSQLQLEADAREALPYKFDQCTRPLGKLRQSLFSCLTCNPVPDDPNEKYNAASVCYSCSIQCHGDHTLVELFVKREFDCDCGTTRFPITSPCTLRINPVTNERGVHSEKASATNKYNQNFRNRFCGCECLYDAEEEKGTMYQCLGLGTVETGGCGEDWWHPECILGLERECHEDLNESGICMASKKPNSFETTTEAPISKEEEGCDQGRFTAPLMTDLYACSEVEGLNPPGFPNEDDFEGFICYKCVDAYPWIKRYAGTPGFLPAIYRKTAAVALETDEAASSPQTGEKRKKDKDEDGESAEASKRSKKETKIEDIKPDRTAYDNASVEPQDTQTSPCRIEAYPVTDSKQFSLFFKEDFRSHLCHCNSCFPKLQVHPQLLQAEDVYEPSVASSLCDVADSTAGSGSIYDRGESALQNIDRIQAIEGVMAYNQLKNKLKPFFQQFAQSGEAISAEDIKAYFAKIRGDELPRQEAGEATQIGDKKHEQHGY